MENKSTAKNKPVKPAQKENQQKIKETIQEEKNNPAVKEALKKENQPTVPDDLSSIHNTHEIGTSGGDQRASETELTQNN